MEKKCFPRKGVIDLPSRQWFFFYKKEKEKNELVARPGDGGAGGGGPTSTTMGTVDDEAFETLAAEIREVNEIPTKLFSIMNFCEKGTTALFQFTRFSS